MIALTLNFKTRTPFFNNLVTVVGKSLPHIERKIQDEFCTIVILELYEGHKSTLTVRGDVYYADAFISKTLL